MELVDNGTSARQEAETRWGGPTFEAGQVENITASLMANWCTRAGLVVTDSSNHAAGFHAIVADPQPAWTLPVMVKSAPRDTIRVVRDQLDFTGVFVFVLLGQPDGGPAPRERTSMIVLDPASAWQLPIDEQEAHLDAAPARVWPLTPELATLLAPDTATTPEELHAVFARHGWRRPATD
ncbi:hypothetical protein [Nocardia noduli]|uniref:hypothetical protein n=1 Tax=Nocardia noduli TaxID=2815722 RepID=UPI001C22C060|nr:hypothetical protein [Nocardia noduli]